MIGHCVARRSPTGTMFAAENSKWPTALTPAFSSNCAHALSATPERMQMREVGFIADASPLRFLDDDASHVARDDPHRQTLGGELAVQRGRQQRERVTVALPALDPLVHGRHPF